MEPTEPDQPPDDRPVARPQHRTVCLTCRGSGTIWRHFATNHGQTAVPQTCPQCGGAEFLPGLQAPI